MCIIESTRVGWRGIILWLLNDKRTKEQKKHNFMKKHKQNDFIGNALPNSLKCFWEIKKS